MHKEKKMREKKDLGKCKFNCFHSAFTTKCLTLSQTTNFRLLQTERNCRGQFHI